ncbi:lipid-A-disaccharide kinase [Duganella sp. CF517]|uniref:tetraacyldisaccharide 4'-kinase n=1 Tax=Duganella sp. CF517 TaxID=1881038 RepID=UPI0008ACC52F|nr:tetraacyldisaccharide 4'-kinase [Duganella sp. CF517]SEN49192.1 lipid-A-disaccharide kinase [Duganella sp. CF517]
MSASTPHQSSALETTLTRNWLRRGPLACALWPLSLLFRAVSGLRAGLYRAGLLKSSRLPVPVVVVGNIYIGGTGKTPLTIWLVQALQAAGMRPGVVSRGHGSDADGAREVGALSTPAEVGDEPLLIKQRTGCPVMVGRDRAATGRALLAAHPEVDIVLTDDGLQHYALQRDIEIILFDGRGAGNGWLLPAGPLREPVSRRRDFTVINAPLLTAELVRAVGGPPPKSMAGSDPDIRSASTTMSGSDPDKSAPIQMTLVGEYAEQLRDRGQRRPLAALNQPGLRLAAAAGIGNPARFFGMLKAAGLSIAELPLPDHHDFADRPFARLEADIILMTEKDAVKCAQIEELRDDPRLWVVPVTARIDAALADQIVEKCRGR